MENLQIDYLRLYNSKKASYDSSFPPKPSDLHIQLGHKAVTVSDFWGSGYFAAKYRIDMLEFGKIHEWYHWISLSIILALCFVKNIKTFLLSSALYYFLGKYLIGNGNLGLFFYFLLFTSNWIGYVFIMAREMFAYHLSVIMESLSLVIQWGGVNSNLFPGKKLDTIEIEKNLPKAHILEKVIPFIVFGTLFGILLMGCIDFVGSVNYVYNVKTYIFFLAFLVPLSTYYSLSVLYFIYFFKNFFSKEIQSLHYYEHSN